MSQTKNYEDADAVGALKSGEISRMNNTQLKAASAKAVDIINTPQKDTPQNSRIEAKLDQLIADVAELKAEREQIKRRIAIYRGTTVGYFTVFLDHPKDDG